MTTFGVFCILQVESELRENGTGFKIAKYLNWDSFLRSNCQLFSLEDSFKILAKLFSSARKYQIALQGFQLS